MSRSAVTAVFFILRLAVACGTVSFAGNLPAQSAVDSKPLVFYLHTEFLPYEKTVERGLPYRLGREIIRQAVLLAARDEMGLATCDETLHETPSNNAQIVEMLLVERSDSLGKANVKLIPYEGESDVWEKNYKLSADAAKIYSDLIPQLETDTRGAFLEPLRAAGLRGEKPKSQDPQPPGEEIEQLLSKVDFVAQFAAVRAAHRAIATCGETPEWLGVLTRGYGNLALLTKHHWNSSCEVFTARAWLYAQRMVAADPQSDLALWHRAYAAALGGILHRALADLEEIEQRRRGEDGSEESVTDPNGEPLWSKLIKPYCLCDRDAIRQVGERNATLQPWATRLWFQVASCYRQPQWIYEAAGAVNENCPTAYGVYADMVTYGQYLAVTRSGAAWAPVAFSRFVPLSLSTIADLPQPVQQLIATNTIRDGVFGGLFGGTRSSEMFSTLPMLLAERLRQETEQATPTDLSWSVLAFLIEEQQFVQVVHYFLDAENATEHSLADEVDAVWPLVKDHRFAPYIESFRYGRRKDAAKMQELLGTIEIEDPRMNMCRMFNALWYVRDAQGQSIGYTAYVYAYRNFTMQGLLEVFERYTSGADRPSSKFSRALTYEFRKIVPHSDISVYLDILWNKEPKLEQLKQWESQVKVDPRTFSYLALRYQELNDLESAVRCYEKSLASVPTVEAGGLLAELYRRQGDWDKWERVLHDVLETEDLGLEHIAVHIALATRYAERGQWRKGKPYAVAYAQTWAAFGLYLASVVCEALAEWEESESWVRAGSEGYPSSAGWQWYFWCRRTGRGDVKAARELAENYFSAKIAPTRDSQVFLGIYRLLEGDTRGALDAYRRALSFRPSFTCTLMVAQLSRELADEKSRKDVLNAMEKAAVDPSFSSDPNQAKVAAAGMAIVELLRTGDVSRETMDSIDESLFELDRTTRGAFAYFVGKELDVLGKAAEAEKYWRRALVNIGTGADYLTLAGYELAKRHGTSRPDDDELDEDDLWPPRNTEQSSQ